MYQLTSDEFWQRVMDLKGATLFTLTTHKRVKIVRVDEKRVIIEGTSENRSLGRLGKRGLYSNYVSLHKTGKLTENYWSSSLPIIRAAVPNEVEQNGSELILKPENPESIFNSHIDSLKSSLDRLLEMTPITPETLPMKMPLQGIYLLSEGKHHLYVGRSNDIRKRIGRHSRPGATHRMAAFAFRLAREATGNLEATYKKGDGSRSGLMEDPAFKQAFLIFKATHSNNEFEICRRNRPHKAVST